MEICKLKFNMGGYPVEGSGPDCKSGVSDSVGSIPTPPTIEIHTANIKWISKCSEKTYAKRFKSFCISYLKI